MSKKQKEREALGNTLRAFREESNLSKYKVAQEGKIREDQVTFIELGERNYTIDAFLGYLRGCDLTRIIKKEEE